MLDVDEHVLLISNARQIFCYTFVAVDVKFVFDTFSGWNGEDDAISARAATFHRKFWLKLSQEPWMNTLRPPPFHSKMDFVLLSLLFE